jgi:aspartyl-tRNA(Asn)/glutamyl-tRNA(Gln) amidotransferase subunit C
MSLSLDDVKRVAHLARIRVTEGEAEQTRDRLNGVFELIAAMQAVDTRDIAPMAHARDVFQRLRADMVTESDRRAAYQAVAPQTEDGLYLVPKVIE